MFVRARPFSPTTAGRFSFSNALVLPLAKLPQRRVAWSLPAREAATPPHERSRAATGLAALMTSTKIKQSSPMPPCSASTAHHLSAGRESTSATNEPLTGSVVLQALQRAVVKREEKRKNKKGGKNWKAPPTSVGELPSGIDYEDVRPIEIRSNWAQRIDELEKRVQELQA